MRRLLAAALTAAAVLAGLAAPATATLTQPCQGCGYQVFVLHVRAHPFPIRPYLDPAQPSHRVISAPPVTISQYKVLAAHVGDKFTLDGAVEFNYSEGWAGCVVAASRGRAGDLPAYRPTDYVLHAHGVLRHAPTRYLVLAPTCRPR